MPLHFLCLAAVAIDGDTLRCANIAQRRGDVRLARIDAPELRGHCRRGRKCAPGDRIASRANLQAMLTGSVACEQVDANPFWGGFQGMDRYGRLVVHCRVAGRDLGAAQLVGGYAVRWSAR